MSYSLQRGYAAYLKISSAMPSAMSDLSLGGGISSITFLLNSVSSLCQLSEAEFQQNMKNEELQIPEAKKSF